VLEYTQQWEDYVTRQARWVDFERGYKTLDTATWSRCCGRSRAVGQGPRLRGAPRAAVLLARRDPVEPRAAHGRRRLQDAAGPLGHRHVPARRREGGEPGLTGVRALAWTTTPWTLPTNLALAVGPDIEYVVVPGGPTAADVPASTTRRGGTATWLPTCSAVTRRTSDTRTRPRRPKPNDHSRQRARGRAYDRLFDYYADAEVGHRAPGASSSTTTSARPTAPASCTRHRLR
jgi:isoleucyl-tRNA synthetase